MGLGRSRWAASIIAISTLLHLPVLCDLIDRTDLLSPNVPEVASLPGEVLTIACLPLLIGLVLAVWSLRTTRGRTALAVALAIAGTVAGWHAYHFSVVAPGIHAANR